MSTSTLNEQTEQTKQAEGGDTGTEQPPTGESPAKTEPPTDNNGDEKPSPESDNGFPTNTPVKDMTSDEKAAYWRFQARKSERERNELRDENTSLKRDAMTAAEKAIADAKAEGERAGRSAAEADYRDRSLGYIDGHISALVEARGLKREDYADFIDSLDKSKFLTAEGDVDTDRVARVVGGVLGAGPQHRPGKPDMGQGNRGNAKAASGIEAGRQLYADTHSK